MDYYAMMAAAIDFMERNLTRDIALEEIAASAGLSLPHLYRIFPVFAGCTPGQYIRRRRLSEAAELLGAQGSVGMIDVALDYQFESQEGFIRAFKAMFEVTPGEYRRNPVAIPLYRRANIIQPQKEGIVIMQPQIVKKQFNLIGLECEIDLNSDFSSQLAALTDALLMRVGEIPALLPPPHIVNMWYPKFEDGASDAEPATCFFTGVEAAPDAPLPEGFIGKRLPESLFAVFVEQQRGTVGGPDGYAYQSWLPDSGYLLNDQIPGDLEEYPDLVYIGYDAACRIYIPICVGNES